VCHSTYSFKNGVQNGLSKLLSGVFKAFKKVLYFEHLRHPVKGAKNVLEHPRFGAAKALAKTIHKTGAW
jgi:hypothetical protein